jgi:maltokinase
LDEALEVTAGEPGERLRALEPLARAALDQLAGGPLTTRVHGDLHVGQVLRWDGGYAVSDFDGNPVLPAGERAARQPPARDVAGMLRSLDHVGRVVDRRTGGRRRAEVESWIEVARRAFLGSYRAALAAAGRPELLDERLLRPFEVEQECRELVYAARHLPRWTYVPDQALGPLLGRARAGER